MGIDASAMMILEGALSKIIEGILKVLVDNK
jgi:hypothetical protein